MGHGTVPSYDNNNTAVAGPGAGLHGDCSPWRLVTVRAAAGVVTVGVWCIAGIAWCGVSLVRLYPGW